MLHYLAVLWNEADAVCRERSQSLIVRFKANTLGWRVIVEEEGLVVFCECGVQSIDGVYKLPRKRGVILGRLFHRSYAERSDTDCVAPTPVSFDDASSDALIASEGRSLVEQHWGRYVAFVRDPSSRRKWVIRDPAGDVPCQWTRVLGIDIYFARVQDCEQLGRLTLSINNHFLLGYLVYSSSCVRETTFNEIETVLPGERVEHRGPQREHCFLWNPLEISTRGLIEDEAEATRQLRNTVRACVHAWASCFDKILLSLSGGLDSSILLMCLASAPTSPHILCRHRYLEGTDSDERVASNSDERFYARLAARHAGVELLEEESKIDYKPEAVRHTVRSLFPVGWPIDVDEEDAENAFLLSRGILADFRGHMGDEVFFRFGSLPVSVDYSWLHGINRRLFSIALDDAAVHRVSLTTVLRIVARYGIRKQLWHMRDGVPLDTRPLMNASLIKEASRDFSLWHPLFRSPGKIPPAKMEHAHMLTYGTVKSYDPLCAAKAATNMAPLASQPLLELSLRSPLHVLRAGGIERAIARRAFSEDLPREIAIRKAKAFGTERYRVIVSQNLSTIRELLLDGYLVREGFLDRNKLEQVLSGRVSTIPSELVEVCDYLSIEGWVRGWAGMAPDIRFMRSEPRVAGRQGSP